MPTEFEFSFPIGKFFVLEKPPKAERGYYTDDEMGDFAGEVTGHDPIDHPAHYERGGIETIAIVERVVEGLDAHQGFCLANVLKYALRAGQKGDAETDLAKANNYAHRLCTGEWRWQHGRA